ncbi:MAG: secretin and TonB N-terminal domain-containing protein, partial [Burkholderiales bacterium]
MSTANAARLLLALSLILGGCAGWLEFREGKQLLEDGKPEQGLEKLEAAVKADPYSAEYRSYLFRQRDALIQRELDFAEAARRQGNLEAAEAAFQRVLKLDDRNARASAGIIALQMDRRHAAGMAEAEQLLNAGELDGAEALLRSILNENPEQRAVRELMRTIAEQKNKDGLLAPQLKTAFRKPITLEFREAPLKSVFEIISRTAGINFIFDKDVKPDLKATIFVNNTRIEDAVDLLLVTNQLEKKILNENTVLVFPSTAAKLKEYQDLVVKSFYLANADVKQTLNMI